MIDVFLKFDLSVKWSSGARYINFLYSSRVEARTLPCTFIALPRFKFLYIGNGNKVFILGVSWYQSNAFTFLSSCEIVIEYLSIYRSPKFQLESRKRGLNKINKNIRPFHSISRFSSRETTNEKPTSTRPNPFQTSIQRRRALLTTIYIDRSVRAASARSYFHVARWCCARSSPVHHCAACTRIVGGVAPEKASWLARSDPLRSVLRARRGKYNKSACIRPGRWHREACAVFSLAASFQSAHGEKGEVTLPPNAKITSQQCPLKCHYSPSPPLGHLFIGWFLLGQNGETGSISTKTSRLETAAYRSRLALLRKTLAAFRPRLANDLAV